MQPLFIIRYSLNSENAMFTASELLERINSHIAELQFTRTPQGFICSRYLCVVHGWKKNPSGIDVDGLQSVSGGYLPVF